MPNSSDVVRNWRVLHACETAAPVAAVAEAQSQVGMTPQLLSREYWAAAPAAPMSLLTTWHDIRDWRHALNEAEALTSVQIVHAHSFASAMAGVRGSLPLVYDFAFTLDEEVEQQSGGGPWLLRSFRVAEQFALSRSAAVVAHSDTMRTVVNQRGAASENIFVVPEPIATLELINDPLWAFGRAIHPNDIAIYALPDPAGIEITLRAFAVLSTELEHAVLIMECEELDREALLKLARELHVADAIRCVASAERDAAMGCSRVVIAPATADAGGRANPGVLRAMAGARAVIAADVPENRECSKDGRGLVWFRNGDAQDLAQRASFVARNDEFSQSLGASGRAHIESTRSAQVVGNQYAEVYRHAHSRRTENLPKIQVPKLYALGAQLI